MRKNKVALVILDGWGINPKKEGNAILLARTPNFDYLKNNFSYVEIQASGLAVGLPRGQMGNSEVGHLNLGAGHVVYQDITMIDREIKEGNFFRNKTILKITDYVKENSSSLHLMGLVSSGGVHSSMNHIKALIKMTKENGIKKLYIHAFLDGRDTPPQSALDFIKELEDYMENTGLGKIALVSGRYYAMDRDKRWDRLELAYKALVFGEGLKADSAREAINASYEKGENDEFVKPTLINGTDGIIRDNDGVIFFNFRPDRGRELTGALTLDEFKEFDRGKKLNIKMATMTEYQKDLPVLIIYPPEYLKNTVGEYLSTLNKRQLRIAETEKYAHVTYFFSGGREKPFIGEERILVPSPHIATYDLQPEMSAYQVKDKVIGEIKKDIHDLIVLNFANPDMVGHTGILEAAIKAIEVVDSCLGKVVKALNEAGYKIIVTSDHGNAEEMIDFKNNSPHTAHTTNPVPFIIVGDKKHELRKDGKLANIAPTILNLMDIKPPLEISEGSMILPFQD